MSDHDHSDTLEQGRASAATAVERDQQLPAALRGHPRRAAYTRESYAVHRRRDLGDDCAAELHAWQLLMPDHGCFTAVTSAQVRGWWLPPVPEGTPVFMALALDDPRPMRHGVRTSRHTRPIGFEELAGIRCAVIPETLLACARTLGLIDLVVMIDFVLHHDQCTIKEIEDVIRPKRPGARELRRALALADGRSESVYETLLRLLHVLCGIRVTAQYVVRDVDGLEVARADLRIVGTDDLPEYDGDEHEKAARRVKDRRRDRDIQRAGYGRRGYTSGDVLHRGHAVLRDAERSLGLTYDPERIRPWLDELQKSLFTPSGQAAFLQRTTPRLPTRTRAPRERTGAWPSASYRASTRG